MQENGSAFVDQSGKSRWLITGITSMVALALIAGSALFLTHRQPAIANPFDTKTLVTTKFALYYPTKLPPGYRIDTKSVNTPQNGIVVFDMQNSHGQKIYMSQEARPSEFDFGGYYKGFSDLKELVTGQGTIATGYVNSHQTVVGSLLINGTWVFVNTNSSAISPSNLSVALGSLTLSQ
jgi:hypothetical protein